MHPNDRIALTACAAVTVASFALVLLGYIQ